LVLNWPGAKIETQGVKMAKRKGSGVLHDIFQIAAVLPWWVGTALALLLYWYLHQLALQPIAAIKTANDMLQVGVWQQGVKLVATVGQYLLPFVLLAGAATSFYQRRKRAKLLTQVQQSAASDPLASLSWYEFELLVGQYFRQLGYRVEETKTGADGGVDLRVKDGAALYLVQCKLWKANKVPVTVVRELFGVMVAEGAAGAIVVTSAEFTADAKAFAKDKAIVLVNGRDLISSVRSKQQHKHN